MPIDIHKLKPGEMCQLLNTTPLEEVISEQQLRRHRTQAGLRIGNGKTTDLIKYGSWLIAKRHQSKSTAAPDQLTNESFQHDHAEVAVMTVRHNTTLTTRQGYLITAMLVEPTCQAAYQKVGISKATFYRWMNDPAFQTAFEKAKRELHQTSMGRVQAASTLAVETITKIARSGRRESDRLHASKYLIELSQKTTEESKARPAETKRDSKAPFGTSEIVQLLVQLIKDVSRSDLSVDQKTNLTTKLTNSLLKAIVADTDDKRQAALEQILTQRGDHP